MTGLDPKHLRLYVVRPVLEYLDPEIPYSIAAENLVMGTAAQESRFRWLDQLSPGPGPAFGLWQMERATYDDHRRWLSTAPRNLLDDKVRGLSAPWPADVTQLHTNLALGAAMCRVHYRRRPGSLPQAGDIAALGAYWKEHYNTRLGKGTAAEFVAAYRETGLYA